MMETIFFPKLVIFGMYYKCCLTKWPSVETVKKFKKKYNVLIPVIDWNVATKLTLEDFFNELLCMVSVSFIYFVSLHKKMKFSLRDFFLVTFTEEILNGKLHFFVQCVRQEKKRKLLVTLTIILVPWRFIYQEYALFSLL